jgi:uncharacterized membrane protein YhaH (DUF805 family)
MKNLLLKIFSYTGEFNRKEYLLIGIFLPVFILGLTSLFLHTFEDSILTSVVVLISIILMFTILLSSTIKRANEIGENRFLLVLLLIIFTPITIIYLLLMPKKSSKANRVLRFTLLGFIIAMIIMTLYILTLKYIKNGEIEHTKKELISYK